MIRRSNFKKQAGRVLAALLAASMIFTGNVPAAFAAQETDEVTTQEETWGSSAEDEVTFEATEEAAAAEASEKEADGAQDIQSREAVPVYMTQPLTDTDDAEYEEAQDEEKESVSALEEEVIDAEGSQEVTETQADGESVSGNSTDTGNTVSSPSVNDPFKHNAFEAPANFKAVLTKQAKIKLTWKKVKKATSYRIYRMKPDGTIDSSSPIYDDKKPSFLDSTADISADTYAYAIMAYGVDASGEEGCGDIAYTIATPIITEVKRTTKDDNLIAFDLKYTQIKGATGYEIYRASTKKGMPVLVKTAKTLSANELEPITGGGKIRSKNGATIYAETVLDGDDPDYPVVASKYYYYSVKALFTPAGSESISSDASVLAQGRITSRAPKNLTVSANSGTTLYLTWEDMEQATDRDGNKLISAGDYYQLYMAQNNGKFKPFAKIKANSNKLDSIRTEGPESEVYLSEDEAKELGIGTAAGMYKVRDVYYKVGYEIEDLKPMQTYTFQVSVLKNKVEGSKSDEASAFTDLSDITNFKIKGTDLNTATLQWDEVEGATGYNVYCGEISETQYRDATQESLKKVSYDKPVKAVVTADKDGVCTFVKTKLAKHTCYAFYVEPTYNKKIHDSGSNRVYRAAKTRIQAPDVTVKQNTYNAENNTLKLSWPKISKATGYRIRYIIGTNKLSDLDSSTNWGYAETKGKNTTSLDIKGVKMGQPVAIRITTLCTTGGLSETDDDAIGNSYEEVEYACPKTPEVTDTFFWMANKGADLRLKHNTAAPTNSVRGYQIWRSAKKSKGYELIAEFTNADLQYKDDIYLKDGKMAYYRIYDFIQGTENQGSDPTWKAVSRDYVQTQFCNSTSVGDSDISVKVNETKEYTLNIKPAKATVKQVSSWMVSDDKTDSFTKGATKNDYIKITTTLDNKKSTEDYYSPTIKITGKKKGKCYIYAELTNGLAVTIRVNITEGDTSSDEKEDDGKDGKGTIIVLDPGHGGTDGGCAYGNLKEKDLTLTISKKTKKYLENAGFTVYLTRSSDKYVELEERVKYAKDKKATAIISQHINSGSGKGVECYYSVDGTGKSLASKMCSNTASATGMNNRGAKTKESTSNAGKDYYAIIRYARSSSDGGAITGLIMENGFIQKDYEYMDTDDELDTIAKANAKAIINYYGD